MASVHHTTSEAVVRLRAADRSHSTALSFRHVAFRYLFSFSPCRIKLKSSVCSGAVLESGRLYSFNALVCLSTGREP